MDTGLIQHSIRPCKLLNLGTGSWTSSPKLSANVMPRQQLPPKPATVHPVLSGFRSSPRYHHVMYDMRHPCQQLSFIKKHVYCNDVHFLSAQTEFTTSMLVALVRVDYAIWASIMYNYWILSNAGFPPPHHATLFKGQTPLNCTSEAQEGSCSFKKNKERGEQSSSSSLLPVAIVPFCEFFS